VGQFWMEITPLGGSILGGIQHVSSAKLQLADIYAPDLDLPRMHRHAAAWSNSVGVACLIFEICWGKSPHTDGRGQLGKVWIQPSDFPSCSKTLDANYAQIFAGMAWLYQYYANAQSDEDRGRYESAEDDARATRRRF